MTSDKTGIVLLSKLLVTKGVSQVVYSPGSRNAPIAIAFSREEGLNCIQIVDERSAAFFALGLALESQKPVALVCTSGSAVLNYAPAIAEAYYSEVPLIILTADRPAEWIDQDESQTIRQKGVYNNYILGNFELPASHLESDTWQHSRVINEAINLSLFPRKGPVHINIPLREPLYGLSSEPSPAPRTIERVDTEVNLAADSIRQLREDWTRFQKKLLIVGSYHPDVRMQDALSRLANDPSLVILTENTSNLNNPLFFEGTDKLIDGLDPQKQQEFVPDLLITIGKRLVSRKIKAWLRKQDSLVHWQVDASGQTIDSYQHLTRIYPVDSVHFLGQLAGLPYPNSNYQSRWANRRQFTEQKHLEYLSSAPFSDLSVFGKLVSEIPQGAVIHAGNSTPIRYLQLFRKSATSRYFSNRGTSGIDGSVSTAAGFAFNSPDCNVLITGDLGFFYDSNALWNQHLPANLKIILINNGGGGIFRIIEGPSNLPELDKFFEAGHSYEASSLAKAYHLSYFKAANESELKQVLPDFLNENTSASILEIFTDRETNASVLKGYFDYLKQPK